MAITHDIMAKTGTYTDSSGQEKARWTKCGVLMEKDGRLSIKLEAIPAAGWDGWLSCFEPRPKDGQQQRPSRPQRSRNDDPFGDEPGF